MFKFIIGITILLIFAVAGLYFVWRGIVFDKKKENQEKELEVASNFIDGHFIVVVFQLILIGLHTFSEKLPNWVTKTIYIVLGLVILAFAAKMYFS